MLKNMSREIAFPKLGESRTKVKRNHAFISPDGHVQTTLPNWQKAMVTILVSPQMGARFTQYLVDCGRGSTGSAALAGIERFVFVTSGSVTLEIGKKKHVLEEYGYALIPADTEHKISSKGKSQLNIFERRYIPIEGHDKPKLVMGNERKLKGEAFLGDEQLICRKLLPEDIGFDIAVNTMSFEPGTPLPFVETHIMEHGMLMLEGGGVYRLDDDWYPIYQGDNLWMGPYCPQWFGCLGKVPAKYLLYKENNREADAHAKLS